MDQPVAHKERQPALILDAHNGRRLSPAVPVYLPATLTADEFRQILPQHSTTKADYAFVALQNWFGKLQETLESQDNDEHPFHEHPYRLRELDIQAVDWFWRDRPGFRDKLGFIKLQAKIETDPYRHGDERHQRADWLPGAVFLRGGSVAILIIVQSAEAIGNDNCKYVILTVQPRIAVASLAFTEIPAGMLDGKTFTGTAASEIEEEAGLRVKEEELINLSEQTLAETIGSEPSTTHAEKRSLSRFTEDVSDHLEVGLYPSPGACDEFIPLFLCQKRLTQRHLNWLKGKATGLRNEGEKIKLKLIPLEEAWRAVSRDAKALAAISLYENLNRMGRIPPMPIEIETEPAELGST